MRNNIKAFALGAFVVGIAFTLGIAWQATSQNDPVSSHSKDNELVPFLEPDEAGNITIRGVPVPVNWFADKVPTSIVLSQPDGLTTLRNEMRTPFPDGLGEVFNAVRTWLQALQTKSEVDYGVLYILDPQEAKEPWRERLEGLLGTLPFLLLEEGLELHVVFLQVASANYEQWQDQEWDAFLNLKSAARKLLDTEVSSMDILNAFPREHDEYFRVFAEEATEEGWQKWGNEVEPQLKALEQETESVRVKPLRTLQDLEPDENQSGITFMIAHENLEGRIVLPKANDLNQADEISFSDLGRRADGADLVVLLMCQNRIAGYEQALDQLAQTKDQDHVIIAAGPGIKLLPPDVVGVVRHIHDNVAFPLTVRQLLGSQKLQLNSTPYRLTVRQFSTESGQTVIVEFSPMREGVSSYTNL